MRTISFLTTCLIALLLAACGGGGGSPGVGSGSVQALSVAAPAAVTLQVGLTQQYVVKGGVKPYTVYSSDPAVVTGWLVGEDVLAVGTTAAGVANVTLQDSKGTKFAMAVTAGSSTAFFTTAPTALTIAPGPLAAQTFKLAGGTPPYKAVSSVPTSLSVVVKGTDVTFTALQLPGLVTVTLSDSSSPPSVLTSVVTLGTIPLAINPAKLEAPVGVTFRAVITGGTPPYRTVVLDNCSTNAKIVEGNILQATTSLACKGAVITVVDANNQTVSVDFDVKAGTVGLQVAPSSLSIPESPTTPSLTLLVYGANGPIQVFTSDTGILAPQATIANSDGTFTIPLAGGNTCSATVTPGSPAVPANPLAIPPTPFIPAVPATGGDRTVTITVIDSTGRQGISTMKVIDSNGVAGC